MATSNEVFTPDTRAAAIERVYKSLVDLPESATIRSGMEATEFELMMRMMALDKFRVIMLNEAAMAQSLTDLISVRLQRGPSTVSKDNE